MKLFFKFKCFYLTWSMCLISSNPFFVFFSAHYIYSFLYWNNNNFSILNFQIIFNFYNFGAFISGFFPDIFIKRFGFRYSLFIIHFTSGIFIISLAFIKNKYYYFLIYTIWGLYITQYNLIYSKFITLKYPLYKERFLGLLNSSYSLCVLVISALSTLIINYGNVKPNFLYIEGEFKIYLFNQIISNKVSSFLISYGLLYIIFCCSFAVLLIDPLNSIYKNKYPNFLFNNKKFDINNGLLKINDNMSLDTLNNENMNKNLLKESLKSELFIIFYLSMFISAFGFLYFSTRIKEFGFEFYNDKFLLVYTFIVMINGFCIRWSYSFFIKKQIAFKVLILAQIIMIISISMRIIFNTGILKYIIPVFIIYISFSVYALSFFVIPNSYFDPSISIKNFGIMNSVFFLSSVLNMLISKLKEYILEKYINYIILILFSIPLLLLIRLNRKFN